MSPDDVIARAALVDRRFVQLQERASILLLQRKSEADQLRSAEDRHAKAGTDQEDLGKAIDVMKAAIVPLTERGVAKLRDLVSFGLRTIFEDSEYALDIEIMERGNDKTAELWLLIGQPPSQLKVKVRDSIGGGVRTVISVILRVFFILHYHQRRVITLDEALTDIAAEYMEGLARFIRYTIDELGFKWLAVTHDPRLMPYADRVYRVKDGTAKLLEGK